MVAAAPLLAAGATAGTGAAAASTAAGILGTGITLSQVATGVGLLSSVMGMIQGNQAAAYSSAASEMEALQIESQAEAEKTRAMQEQAQRQQRLNQILGAQMASAAGRGMGVGSGTQLAIADFSQQEFAEESDIARTDSEQRIRNMRLQAGQSRLSGRASLVSQKTDNMNRAVTTGINTLERTKLI